VELLNAEAWREVASGIPQSSEWVVAVGFEEKIATVVWQRTTLLEELRSSPVQDVTDVPDPAGLWAAITELQIRPESRYIRKASMLPSRIAEELSRATPSLLHAHALNGIVWRHDSDTADGSVVRRCPIDAKKSLSVWGAMPPAWDLMRHLKRTLDPDNVFNPGRLFGDL
jgi:glycolate oxidase FAD binding subunit